MQSFIIRFNNKIFYGWVIAASALIVNAILIGMRLSFGVFFKSLENEFELTRLETSSIVSLLLVFSAISAFIGGWAADRYGPRRIISIMGLCAGASLLLTGQATAFWHLCRNHSICRLLPLTHHLFWQSRI